MNTGVYTITNTINNKIYVGSTSTSFREREVNHFSSLRRNCHSNIYLQNSVNKYGINNFKFEVLEECLPEYCVTTEQYWINMLDVTNPKLGYNKLYLAYSSLGYKHTKTSLAKMSLTQKAFWSGKTHPLKGKKITEEKKIKMLSGLKEYLKLNPKKNSPETREKIRMANLGKKVSAETRLKQSLIKKGKPRNNNKPIIQYDKNMVEIARYNSIQEAVKLNNYKGEGNICNCCKGKLNSSYGYKWKYQE